MCHYLRPAHAHSGVLLEQSREQREKIPAEGGGVAFAGAGAGAEILRLIVGNHHDKFGEGRGYKWRSSDGRFVQHTSERPHIGLEGMDARTQSAATAIEEFRRHIAGRAAPILGQVADGRAIDICESSRESERREFESSVIIEE